MADELVFLLDPRSPLDIAKIKHPARPKTVEGITIGVVDNTKPNFDLFMDTVQEQLEKVYKVGKVIRYRKPGRTKGIPEEMLQDIKEKCDFAITGLGD